MEARVAFWSVAAPPVIRRAKSAASAAHRAATAAIDPQSGSWLVLHGSPAAPAAAPEVGVQAKAEATALNACTWGRVLDNLLHPPSDEDPPPPPSMIELLRAVVTPESQLEAVADAKLRCPVSFGPNAVADHVTLQGAQAAAGSQHVAGQGLLGCIQAARHTACDACRVLLP